MLARRPGASSAHPVVLYDEEGRKKKAVQRYAGTLLFVSVMIGLLLLMLAKYRQEMQFSSAGTSLRYSLGPVETYNEIFETRGRMFNKANTRWPAARTWERDTLLERLDFVRGDRVVDIGAGGGYLQDGIHAVIRTVHVINVEQSHELAKGIKVGEYSEVLETESLEVLALNSSSVTKVISLSALHHHPLSTRWKVIAESYRVLRPGGVLAFAEILDGTPPAKFIADVVHRLSLTGHVAEFVKTGELADMLTSTGFEHVRETYLTGCWEFVSQSDMVGFLYYFFGLQKAKSFDSIAQELGRHIKVLDWQDGVCLPWGMVFVWARKPLRQH